MTARAWRHRKYGQWRSRVLACFDLSARDIGLPRRVDLARRRRLATWQRRTRRVKP